MRNKASGSEENHPGGRQLLIMRHARAEFSGSSDHERPLSAQGRQQAQKVAKQMLGANIVPQLILCSSALRTRTTMDVLLKQWDSQNQPFVEVTDDLYRARPREILHLLRGISPHTSAAMVIGHEPTMSGLAALLAHEQSDMAAVKIAKTGFMTAGLGVLALAGTWQDLEPGGAILQAVRPPESG